MKSKSYNVESADDGLELLGAIALTIVVLMFSLSMFFIWVIFK